MLMKVFLLLLTVAFCSKLSNAASDETFHPGTLFCVHHYLNPSKQFHQHHESQQVLASGISQKVLAASACHVFITDTVADSNHISRVMKDIENAKARHKMLMTHDANLTVVLQHLRDYHQNFSYNFDTHFTGVPNKWAIPKYHLVRTQPLLLHNPKLSICRHSSLRLAYTGYSPFALVGPTNELLGMNIEAWRIIAQQLKQDIEFVKAPSMGSSAAMVRQKIVDGSAMSLILNLNWYKGIDVLANLQGRVIGLVAGQPKQKQDFLTLIDPLDAVVWTNLIIAILLVCVLLGMSAQSGNCSQSKELFDIASLGFGIMINESLPHKLLSLNKTKLSYQVILIIWIPMSALIGMAYQSTLRSSLIKPTNEKPIDTFQDVLEREMTVYVVKGTLTVYLLATSQDPLIREVYKRVVINPVDDYENFLPDNVDKEIHEGKAAHDTLIERSWNYTGRIAQRAKFGTFQCGFYHRMNHPFFDRAKVVHNYMVDGGIVKAIEEKYKWKDSRVGRNTAQLQEIAQSKIRPLSFHHMIPVMVLLALLGCLSFMSFIYECINSKKQEEGKIKPSRAIMKVKTYLKSLNQ